jgi:hypothetical protein
MMKNNKFEFEGDVYNIVDEISNTSMCEEQYEVEWKVTDQKRDTVKFIWWPIYKDKKFRWLRDTKIRQQLEFVRRQHFDDGWTYQNYWGSWEENWDLIEILD